MNCPHCPSSSTTEREGRTVHGFRRFRCRECGRRFKERTGTALNRVQVPTDVVFLVVFWQLRYKLSLRDLAEMLLIRKPATKAPFHRSVEAEFSWWQEMALSRQQWRSAHCIARNAPQDLSLPHLTCSLMADSRGSRDEAGKYGDTE